MESLRSSHFPLSTFYFPLLRELQEHLDRAVAPVGEGVERLLRSMEWEAVRDERRDVQPALGDHVDRDREIDGDVGTDGGDDLPLLEEQLPKRQVIPVLV